MDRTERFYKMQQLIHQHEVVPARRFLRELEISPATFKRDLEYLRSRLNIPIVWDAVANGYRYGFDIMDITGVPGGTVYPALRRLEEAGHLTSKWERASIAQAQPRPPRKYYELTRSGREALAEAVNRYRLLEQTQLNKARDPNLSRA